MGIGASHDCQAPRALGGNLNQPRSQPSTSHQEPQFESLDIEATSAQLEVTNWLHHILSPHKGRPQRLECLPELLNPCFPDLRLAVQQ
jgi:hypothetical protein